MIVAMASPEELSRRLRELPAAVPLLAALGEDARVHLVGGAVRDLLLGRATPVDLDLVVDGDAIALARTLAERLGGGAELRVHERFGTATVRGAGHAYDLAGARAESYARPGALPDVRPGTLAEDLARRDFTVNALALALDGRLDAAPHALDDLAAGLLRVLHDASFVEDPTRLLRLVRYATRLGFAVEPRTDALARAALADGALATVTPTRIGAELRLLLREPRALDALAWVASWGDALGVTLAVDRAVAERARDLLPADGRGDLLLLAGASLAVTPGGRAARGEGDRATANAASRWLDALGFTAQDRDVVVAAATEAPSAAEELRDAARPSEIAAVLGRAPVELAALAGALGAAEPARRWIDELRHVRLEIDGDDLIAAGVPQGTSIGAGLTAALRAKLDGEASGREAELAVAIAGAR
jgi:tRNA nucleotidyltransferase (CCA-adding enzyme)